MSLGGGGTTTACDSDSRKPAIDLLRGVGIATVIAAGNSGFDTQVGAPACISSAITVASSTKQDVRSSFSNWGSLVDVVAPGSSLLSSYPSGVSNTFYTTLSGTSMAAPMVAGAFAALRTAKPNATVDQIESALKVTGLNIASAGVSKPRIRVDLALNVLNGGPPPPPPPVPANDNFANRTVVSAVPSTVNGNNVNATKETGERNHAGLPGATTSVWWRYTPTTTGNITITTVGSNFDTVLAVYTGSALNTMAEVVSNDDAGGATTSSVIVPAVAGVQYQIAVAGYGGAVGNIRLNFSGTPGGTTSIVAAVTPVARATSVGGRVTAFGTILNGGTIAATACSIALPAGTPVTFTYSARNLTTGTPENPGQPVNIPAGGRRDFAMSFVPNVQMAANIALVFDCTNSAPAPTYVGLNTFLLTGAANPPADLLSIAVTQTQDGIMNVPLGRTGFAALAAQNIGAAANLQARLSVNPIGTTGRSLAGTFTMCQTNPTTGLCIPGIPQGTVLNFAAPTNQIRTFTAFVTSNGTAIPFDPANKRLFVHFYQGSNPVGSASVAVRTVAPAPAPTLASAAN